MKCIICNNETQQFYDHHSYCENCDVYSQNNKDVSVDYDKEYVNQYNIYHTTRMMSLLRYGYVVGATGKITGDILDFGFGNGDFLKVAGHSGWAPYGHDVEKRNIAGIYELSLEEVIQSRFDVITFFDSLEHLEDPTMANKLNSDYIIVSCPLKPFNDIRLLNWKHWKPGEHLYHFSIKGLKNLFSNYDYVSHCFIEDSIRGKIDNVYDNILTICFKNKDLK